MSQTKQEEIKAQVTSILKEVEANPLQLRIVIQRLCEENASLKDQLAITEQKLQVFEQARAGIKADSITSPGPSSPRSAIHDNGPSPQKRSKSNKQQAASITSPEPSSPHSASNDAGASPQKRRKTQKQQAASITSPEPSSPHSVSNDAGASPQKRSKSNKQQAASITSPEPSSPRSASNDAGASPQKRCKTPKQQDPEDRRRATEELWKAVYGADKAVEAAVEAGADVRARDDVFGRTPLHEAARSVREAAVLSLLSHGAEVEAKDKDGWTPLHYAAISGHLPCTKLLVERGADLNARDSDGRTPLDLAGNHPTVQQYLRSVGGTR